MADIKKLLESIDRISVDNSPNKKEIQRANVLAQHKKMHSQEEAADPKSVYTQENFKYVPLIEPKKKGAKVKEALEDADDDRYPEFMGGYVTPFTANGAWVLDNEGTQVLKCNNPRFARVVEIALNKSRQGKI